MSWMLLLGIAWTLIVLPLGRLLGRLLRRADRMTSTETDPAVPDVAEDQQAPGDREARPAPARPSAGGRSCTTATPPLRLTRFIGSTGACTRRTGPLRQVLPASDHRQGAWPP